MNWRDPMKGINQSPDGFGGPWEHGTAIVLADGSVRTISKNISPAVLKALSTPNGGEPLPDDY
jgi:hypothetical protein